jgi:hypothetical protein
MAFETKSPIKGVSPEAKMNDNHDERGRFSSGGGVAGSERIGGTGMPHPNGNNLVVYTTHDFSKEGMKVAKAAADAHAASQGFKMHTSSGFANKRADVASLPGVAKAPSNHTHVTVHNYKK